MRGRREVQLFGTLPLAQIRAAAPPARAAALLPAPQLSSWPLPSPPSSWHPPARARAASSPPAPPFSAWPLPPPSSRHPHPRSSWRPPPPAPASTRPPGAKRLRVYASSQMPTGVSPASPRADVEGVRIVPAQMGQVGACGSPGADLAGGEPSPGADVAGR